MHLFYENNYLLVSKTIPTAYIALYLSLVHKKKITEGQGFQASDLHFTRDVDNPLLPWVATVPYKQYANKSTFKYSTHFSLEAFCIRHRHEKNFNQMYQGHDDIQVELIS